MYSSFSANVKPKGKAPEAEMKAKIWVGTDGAKFNFKNNDCEPEF
jgi:hypothetical protein